MTESARSGLGSQTWLAVALGALVGVVIGSASVVGGSLAVCSAAAWPPRSSRWWRLRFAGCSSAAVCVATVGFFVWNVAAAGTAAEVSAEDGMLLLRITAVFAAATGAFTVFLAPAVDAPSDC